MGGLFVLRETCLRNEVSNSSLSNEFNQIPTSTEEKRGPALTRAETLGLHPCRTALDRSLQG